MQYAMQIIVRLRSGGKPGLPSQRSADYASIPVMQPQCRDARPTKTGRSMTSPPEASGPDKPPAPDRRWRRCSGRWHRVWVGEARLRSERLDRPYLLPGFSSRTKMLAPGRCTGGAGPRADAWGPGRRAGMTVSLRMMPRHLIASARGDLRLASRLESQKLTMHSAARPEFRHCPDKSVKAHDRSTTWEITMRIKQ